MELGVIGTRRYFTAVALFMALLLTVLEPAGSAENSFGLRFVQWLLQVSIPLAILIGVHLSLSRLTAFDKLNPWLKLTASGLVGGLLFSPLALVLDFIFSLEPWPDVREAEELLVLLHKESSGVLPPVLLVWLGINAPRVLRLDFSAADSAAGQPVPPDILPSGREKAETGFLEQVPASLSRDIVYLMAELHYLRVVTTNGQKLVLYNLRDAIDELPADKGIQTHRSFWAAFDHIDKIVTRSGRSFVLMDNGDEVPVSRRQASRVKRELAQRLPLRAPPD